MLNPGSVFRNPAKLEQAWALQRAERQKFIDYFGSDLVVMPGSDVLERMRAYMRVRSDGAALPELTFPPIYGASATVGVIYDEVDGLYFVPDFGLVEEVFNDPDLVGDRRHRQAVIGFLESPDLLPLPLVRLAARDPERASEVFRRALKRPTFDWTRDGEALLRKHKPDYYATPPYPSVTSISAWGPSTKGR
jgi:hypothetical protein